MQTSTSTTSALRRWSRHFLCQRLQQARYASRNAETYALHSSRPFVGPKPTFESIGIRAPIASAMRAAFPDIQYPTKAQNDFIPAVLSGRDVLLKDDTGTGKSFGVILALLSKARKRATPSSSGIVSVQSFITSLVIVPHRDLAYQFHHWIDRVVNASAIPGNAPPPLSAIAQIVVRGGDTPISSQRATILAEPPHILIGTPQALLELFDESFTHEQLRSISSVYVDEVDYLIDAIPGNASKRTQEKARWQMERHPSAASQVLDLTFSSRRKKWDSSENRHSSHTSPPGGPQLIMSSATLRRDLRSHLCSGRGWLDRNTLVRVSGPGRPVSGAKNGSVSHCVLVVSKDGQIRNIDGAQEAIPAKADDAQEIPMDEIFSSTDTDVQFEELELNQRYTSKEFNVNPDALEAVATAFALDVPSVALLSLSATAPVQRVVQELRQLGVNAHGLDLLAAEKGRAHLLRGAANASKENPVLLVSTLATTRGLDLPELAHVFILGFPDGRKADGYLHMAGRVGRFGRGGKVITIVEEREEGKKDDGTVTWVKDEPKQMTMLFKAIGVVPTQFEHFD